MLDIFAMVSKTGGGTKENKKKWHEKTVLREGEGGEGNEGGSYA